MLTSTAATTAQLSLWWSLNQASGGTVTTANIGGTVYNIHTFTANGTFRVNSSTLAVDYLIVGGGAGGGSAGGGGGGGQVVTGSTTASSGNFSIIVGTGGGVVTNDRGTNGANSQALSQTAIGGGGGGASSSQNGRDGASGGGGYPLTGLGGTATGGGQAGGSAVYLPSNLWAGGGGGWTSAGEAGDVSGRGGAGYASTFTGSTVYYAAGGGGGWQKGGGVGNVAVGGSGVGGNGAWYDFATATDYVATIGVANSGSGGGGGMNRAGLEAGTAGTAGIVQIRYPYYAPAPVANARRTGTASTNSSQTWTASGAVTSTAQFEFGTASEYASTSSQDIYTSAGTPTFMDYGTGEFCLEWWTYIPSLASHSASCDLMSNDTTGGFGIRLAQSYNTNGLSSGSPQYINIFARAQADLDYWTLPTNWPTGQWNFCALQRKGTTMSFWLNGTLCSNTNNGGGTRNFANNSGNPIRVGTADGSNGAGEVYIDEFCWSNTYRYSDTSADIPVPTAAFTVDSYTTQLMHMDGTNGGTTFTNATS